MIVKEYTQPEGWVRKVFTLIFCLVSPLGAAVAQTVTLTTGDSQGYFWDSGPASQGATVLQLFPDVPGNSAQAFTWTVVPNGYTICNLGENICLSDNGTAVVMGAKADTFALADSNGGNLAAVLDFTTGKYIEQPSTVGNGISLATGSTPYIWTFAFASASTPPPPSNEGKNIMPLGDSITMGSALPDTYAQGGYKCPLYSALLTNFPSLQFPFVGYSYQNEPPPDPETECPATNWEGHGGYTIAEIQSVLDGDGSLTNFQPGIILLLGGTNNVSQSIPLTVAPQLNSLLSDIFAKDPGAWVIVSTIPPMNPNAPDAAGYGSGAIAAWAPTVPLANMQIAATVAQFPQATLVDFYSQVVGNLDLYIGPDGAHPTVTGYAVLANLWYNAIAAHEKTVAATIKNLGATLGAAK